jgi:hypothetical protein
MSSALLLPTDLAQQRRHVGGIHERCKRAGRIVIRRYESKMASYAFGSNPRYYEQRKSSARLGISVFVPDADFEPAVIAFPQGARPGCWPVK